MAQVLKSSRELKKMEKKKDKMEKNDGCIAASVLEIQERRKGTGQS